MRSRRAGTFCCSSGFQDFALARYKLKPDGTLDTSFGSGGKVTTDLGGIQDAAFALAIQADGKLVAAGVSDVGGSSDFALARYNTDGTPDPSFGSAGKVITDFSGSGSTDQAVALAIQSDGKIVAAGITDILCCNTENFALARYNPDGTLDATFGSAGKVITDFSGSDSDDYAYALAIQSDAKVLAGGFSNANRFYDFALARYNPDGALDTSFGSSGKVLTDFVNEQDVIYSLAIQSDGEIVAGGYSFGDFALARYDPDGTLDRSFGSGGKVTTDFSGSGSFEIAFAIAIQSDGKIVATGPSDASGS